MLGLVLARLLGIRPEDRRDTGVAFGTLVAMLAAHSMLETARDALFLDKLPPQSLPLAYIAIAGFALLVSRINQHAAARFSRRRLLSLSLAVGGVLTAVFYQLTAHSSPWMLGALYVWTGVLATVVVLQFWLQLGDVLDVSQAKRLFSLIAAGGLVGATLGSATASALLSAMDDARPLLLISGGIFVVAALVPIGFSTTTEPKRRRRHGQAPRRGGWAMVRGDSYLSRLFAMVLIGAVLVTGVDYVFKAEVVAEAQRSGWNLGVFFARYYAVVNFVSLLVQLLLAPRLLRAVGVNRAVLILPAFLLIASAGFTATAALIPALLMKGADGSLRHSVHRTASEILYLPLQRQVRERFKALSESLGQRGGQALASLLILAASALSPDPRYIGVALVALALAWVASLVGLEPHYLELFRKQLREGSLDTEVDVPDLDLASFELLVSALSAEDDVEVLAALDMFESYGKTELVPALILYHPSRDVVMRAFDIFDRCQRRDVRRLTGRLLKHEDEEIRAAALRTLASAQPDEELLRQQLEDGGPAVRCTALVAMIANGFVDDAEATRLLKKMVHGDCGDTRRALARSLRHLPYDRFGWVAEELYEHGDAALDADIAQSLAARPHERFIPLLIGMLKRRVARAAARSALLALGSAALDALTEVLLANDHDPAVRKHLPRTISRFGGMRATKVLEEALYTETDPAVKFKILRGLGRVRADRPDIEVDRARMLELIGANLEEAITLLSWRMGVGRVIAQQQRAMTPAAELLTALLEDREKSAVQNIFRMLHIMGPTQQFRIIYDGLRSDDAKTKATSRELLSHVVPEAIRRGILAMVDQRSPRKRLAAAVEYYDPPCRARLDAALAATKQHENDADAIAELGMAYAETLRAMLADSSDALRSLVSYHVAELGLDQLRADIEGATSTRSAHLAEVSKTALDRFGLASTPELSGAN